MSAARYYQRSPRYVFRPGDQSLMRFAGMETKGETARARIRDLSTTGLSFVVDGGHHGGEHGGDNFSDTAPFENELLKVEFAVPGHRQIAWFATVTRVEHRSDWQPETGNSAYTLIALKFRPLPHAFQQAIEQSVGGRVTENEVPFSETRDPVALVTLFGLSIGMFAAFFWMSFPVTIWVAALK